MHKKSRANFWYCIGVLEGIMTLLIWDQDIGNGSVTIDIENVVADIATHELINPHLFVIIYRDSEGQWVGWDAVTEVFYPIGRFFKEKPDVILDESFKQLK